MARRTRNRELKKLIPLFLFCTAFATNYAPWFGNVWEVEWGPRYIHYQGKKIDSPNGDFNSSGFKNIFANSLALTVWPRWNLEAELILNNSNDIDFAYEASFITGRYQWLDDLTGDPVSLTTGVTANFPGNRFMHDFHDFYVGDYNIELHLALGKELPYCSLETWKGRVWAYGAYGFANRGSCWARAIGAIDWRFIPCTYLRVFSDFLYGFGSDNLISKQDFTGYASVGYRSVDIGAKAGYHLTPYGTLALVGSYNLYARNFPIHSYTAMVELLIPFSL